MKPRLLVVELHHLGDAVMSLPFIRGAQEKFDVRVLCRPATAAIYELLSRPPEIRKWEPPWADEKECGALEAIRAARAEGRRLSSPALDTAVCAWADARTAILMAAAGAGRRIGFPMTRRNYYAADLPWRAKRLWAGRLLEKFWAITHHGQPLLTRWLHRETARQPHIVCWEQMAEATGVACDYDEPWISAAPSREFDVLRAAAGRKQLLAVHTLARLPSKQWSPDKWRALCSSLALRENFELLEVLPPGNEPCLDGMARIVAPDVAALASILSAADALVCHDSLPAHLAAALGKRVVTIFGSGEPDWFAPWNNRQRAVQRRICPLHPCIDRCGMDSYLCLDAVTVDDVAKEIMKLAAKP
jgi:ADP-heptose:LPS heptosyltransferase